MIVLNIIYGMVALFLCFYFSLFLFETIQLKINPRPKFVEKESFRFKDLHIAKTQTFGEIVAR